MDGSVKIRLAHFTVQEFLESTRIREGIAAEFHLESRMGHLFITQSCVTYLMHYSSSDEKKSSEHDLLTFPPLRYAAATWYRHSALHETSDVSSEMKLLHVDATMRDWLNVHRPDWSWAEPFTLTSDHGSNLYYASYMDLGLVVQLLLEEATNFNAEGGYYCTALQAASYRGHIEVVTLLLGKGADVDLYKEGGLYGTALQAASVQGHLEVVTLLLEKGANVNAEGGLYRSALLAASQQGHLEVVTLLLEKGANVNVEEDRGNAALYDASCRGHIEVVTLLLEKGASVNGLHVAALQTALYGGHIEVVTLLLEKGANVDEEGAYDTALQIALDKGYLEVVTLLLEKGAKVSAEGGRYGTALQAASDGGRTEVATLLEERIAYNPSGP